MRIPVIAIPLKKGKHLDFNSLSDYITNYYEQDVADYIDDMELLNSTRLRITGDCNNQEKRDAITKYYYMLESVEKRFTSESCQLDFEWQDSFTAKIVVQQSFPFEKACILFNYAAIYSLLGSVQDRFENIGLKQAFNDFQCSASIFHVLAINSILEKRLLILHHQIYKVNSYCFWKN